MRVLVCGTRDAPIEQRFELYRWLYLFNNVSTIISGAARGPDTWGEAWAGFYHSNGPVAVERYPADWETHGKAAGFMRNSTMVNACDMVVAVWDGTSKGTQDTIRKARLAKKPTVILYF